MHDEELWKKRFQLFMLVRLAGLAIFVIGLIIAFSDLVREGGWRVPGAIIAIMGLIDAVLAPRMLRRIWEKEDAGR